MSKKILIIEDEASIADLERDYLELAGYEVNVIDNGESGLKEAVNGSYDMLIIDIMLPGKDGFEILKSVSGEKDIPVILVSAKKSDIDKVKAFGLGADDYITKPFSPSELTARVKAHLMRYDRLKGIMNRDSDIISSRGLKIDKRRRKVYLNGVDRDLTQKEFDLLLFLAEHGGQTFSKKELFERVWGMDSLGDDVATVTVHIKRIREKIEKNTQSPNFVETVWGVGYRFKN